VPRAIWKDRVIADAVETVVVEGNHYFPPDSIDRNLVRESETRTRCGWKGQASYLDLVVGDAVNPDACWYYPKPKRAARHLAGHVAFWQGRGVTIEPG
jgi:uncharacterized protein (DUF427 family)